MVSVSGGYKNNQNGWAQAIGQRDLAGQTPHS